MRICVLGGAGYVGSALVPQLLDQGHTVTVFDTFWYGTAGLPKYGVHVVNGDMRSSSDCRRAFSGQDALIHLACISNDPSFELNSSFAQDVNGPDTMQRVLATANNAGIRRLIYASSSSVYGVKTTEEAVTESSLLEPITDYSRFKVACEGIVIDSPFEWTILRPATVCGWAPRLRLDVVVNAMTASALQRGVVTVHGGTQIRPNILIDDMVRAYQYVLSEPKSYEQIYNVGGPNLSLFQIGEEIADICRAELIVEGKVQDKRSYRIDSTKFGNRFSVPGNPIEKAVRSIREHLWYGQHTVNIKRMQEVLSETTTVL